MGGQWTANVFGRMRCKGAMDGLLLLLMLMHHRRALASFRGRRVASGLSTVDDLRAGSR